MLINRHLRSNDKVRYSYKNVLFMSVIYSITLCKVFILNVGFWQWSIIPSHSVPNRNWEKWVNRILSPWTAKLCTVPLLLNSLATCFLTRFYSLSRALLEPVCSNTMLLLSQINKEKLHRKIRNIPVRKLWFIQVHVSGPIRRSLSTQAIASNSI